MKSNNIFLLGDFNCDLLGVKERTEVIDNNLKTRNGYWIYLTFFNMQNVVDKPFSVTFTTVFN